MLNEIKVGQQTLADGVTTTARADKTGALVVASVHGGFTESAVRATIMYGTNAVAGVAHGTALSVAPPLTLWNPPSSGKNLSITKVSMGYVSGTLGGGCVALAVNLAQATVPTTGTEIVPLCSMLGMPRGVGRVFALSTIAAIPSILRTVFTIGAFAGGTTPAVDTDVLVDGGIVVTPGTCISLQGIATAGTAPLVIFGFTWEEISI